MSRIIYSLTQHIDIIEHFSSSTRWGRFMWLAAGLPLSHFVWKIHIMYNIVHMHRVTRHVHRVVKWKNVGC